MSFLYINEILGSPSITTEELRYLGEMYTRARLTEESFARAIFSPGEVRISKSFFIKRERIERMCSV